MQAVCAGKARGWVSASKALAYCLWASGVGSSLNNSSARWGDAPCLRSAHGYIWSTQNDAANLFLGRPAFPGAAGPHRRRTECGFPPHEQGA